MTPSDASGALAVVDILVAGVVVLLACRPAAALERQPESAGGASESVLALGSEVGSYC